MIKQREGKLIQLGSTNLWYVNNSNGNWGPVGPHSTSIAVTNVYPPVQQLLEIIQYENTGGKRFGRCFHRRHEFLPTGTTFSHAAFANPINNELGYFWESNYLLGALMGLLDEFGRLTDYPPDTWTYRLGDVLSPMAFDSYDWGAFSGRSMEAMIPSLEDGSSVLNFFYELRDMKTLFKSVIGKFGLRKGAGWKQIFRAVSGVHLTYEFAVAPFISDLERIFGKLLNWRANYAEFLERAGKPQTSHYREFDEVTPNNHLSTIGPYRTYGIRHGGPVRVQRQATMRYTYSIVPALWEPLREIAAFFAILGINPARPSIIWNAIPFTFLIDWFIDIGDMLDRHSAKEILPVNVKILDYCVSQKFKTTSTWVYEADPTYTEQWMPSYDGKVAYATSEVYQRERMVPDLTSTSTLNDPGLRQLSLATSLLVAVSGKRKR